jgi:hypothetical protein
MAQPRQLLNEAQVDEEYKFPSTTPENSAELHKARLAFNAYRKRLANASLKLRHQHDRGGVS